MTHELANPGEDRSKKVFGLIQSTRGGSRVEAWTPQYALESCGIDANVDSIDHVRSTSWLFNAMISPILMHTLYGVLWYQGKCLLDTKYN